MLYKSDERVRIYEQKYVTEVQRENSKQSNYYTKCPSDENKKTKSLKGLLQEVHVLLPVQFKISSARRATFNYKLKTGKNDVVFVIFSTALKRQRICNNYLHQKVVPIYKLSNDVLYATFRCTIQKFHVYQLKHVFMY